MKDREIFEVCHARYKGLRDWLADSAGQVRALNLEMPASEYQWRPPRSRAAEYVADFERIGRSALRRAEWKGRLRLFEIYFLAGVEYRRAITLVGAAEGTFDYWTQEVKRAVGAALKRTAMFPPSSYFNSQGVSSQIVPAGQKAGSVGADYEVVPDGVAGFRATPENNGLLASTPGD